MIPPRCESESELTSSLTQASPPLQTCAEKQLMIHNVLKPGQPLVLAGINLKTPGSQLFNVFVAKVACEQDGRFRSRSFFFSPLPALWFAITCSWIFGSRFLIGPIACLGIIEENAEGFYLGGWVSGAMPCKKPNMGGDAAINGHLACVCVCNRTITSLKYLFVTSTLN